VRSGCLGGEKKKRVQVVYVVIGAEVGVLWFGCEILALIRVSLPAVPAFVMIGNLGHVHGPAHLADELPLILDGPLSVKAVTGVEGRSRVLRSEH
jgi:xanthosine utilization system XapX-like protein